MTITLLRVERLANQAMLAMLLWHGVAAAADDVKVANAWVGATAPGQQVAGAYMEVQSPVNAALVSVQSPIAGGVEIHLMKMENDIMKMRRIEKLDLPAGKTVKLEPGGHHLMLTNLKQQLRKGETVPLTLTVERKDKTKSTVEVKALVREMHGSGHTHH